MRKRFIDGTNWKSCKKTTSRVFRVSEFMPGYVSLVNIVEVENKLVVKHHGKKTTLLDAGYKRIVFLPDNDFWCAQAMYDENNNIIEWYFDITSGNYVDENNKPCFDDLYLDVVLLPYGEIIGFDEDELLKSYAQKEISKEQFLNAKSTARKIIKEYIPDKEFIFDFFNNYLQMFTD